MPAARHDIVIEEGATFDITFTYLDKDGVAIDVTGYSAKMDIKESVGGTLIDALTSVTSEIAVGTTDGIFQILLVPATTAAYDFDWGVYDLEITTGGVTVRLVEGRVEFRREVTTS